MIALTSARLFELEIEHRSGKTRVVSLRELRRSSCEDVLAGGEGFDVAGPSTRTFA